MRQSLFRSFLVASTLSLALTSACSDSSGPGTGTLSLRLTDAPGDVLAAVVTISEINLQGTGGTTVLSSSEVTTDLLTLSGSTATLLNGATVNAGTYSQLRFVITGAYIEVDNGDGTSSIYATSPTYPGLPAGAAVSGILQTPSFDTSGLKVTLPGDHLTITDGGETILLVDFDVSQSFGQQAGGSGQWVMHPVIVASDVTVSGSAQVNLSLDPSVTLPAPGGTQVTLADFSATLSNGGGFTRTVTFTDTDGDGTFTADFAFLAPGDYSLSLEVPAGVASLVTTPSMPQTVTVQAGATATQSISITGAS